MLAKIGSENGKYMVEFQADARVGFGKCIHFFGVGTRLRTGEVNPLFGFENVIEAGLVGAGSNVYSSIRETMEEKKGKCQDK